MVDIMQTPVPGTRLSMFGGDVAEFVLRMDEPRPGAAWLRTNLGRGALRRREIAGFPRGHRPACDWWDIPMHAEGQGVWRIRLPLLEPGHFEAKCFFMPARGDVPLWPSGGNVTLNVHPAAQACATLVYNAFVRQFGSEASPPPAMLATRAAALENSGCTVLPPSGKFRDLARELDFIVGHLGCRVLLLLPIHPVPTVYGRMGKYGSPYAALDFFDVDPALAEFDRYRTPMEQFEELAEAVHARRAHLWLDMALNHTGWAARLHTLHPEWLERAPDGEIRSPGAWGVVWEDLTALDHNARGLLDYLVEVFRFWCRHGVDGFRCDAAYMVPLSAWEYMVARVRDEYPETFFLLEGLGGSLDATVGLLNEANMDAAYSELFQNYDRSALEGYLPLAANVASGNGLMMHFAETHDNNRLAARSPAYARMRTALAALASFNGAFAFANGLEWLAREKIDVHGRASLNWGAAENMVGWIKRLQALLRCHPVFHPGAGMRLIQSGNVNALAVLRSPSAGSNALLALINLDDRQPVSLLWPKAGFDRQSGVWPDLLSGRAVRAAAAGEAWRVDLAPAEVLCLAADPGDVEALAAAEQDGGQPPVRVLNQLLRRKALEIFSFFSGFTDLGAGDADAWAAALQEDPAAFCRSMAPGGEDCISRWQAPRDSRREVMVPHGHLLLVEMPHPFRLRLERRERVMLQEDALPSAGGNFFVLAPPPAFKRMAECELRIMAHFPDGTHKLDGRLLCLPPGENAVLPRITRRQAVSGRRIFLAVNGRGGMLRAALAWGEIYSRYDALLAANLHPRHPVNRRVMLTRCRAWLVYRGYSRELDRYSLAGFRTTGDTGVWTFRVPFGADGYVQVRLDLAMEEMADGMRMTVVRETLGRRRGALADDVPVRLVLRPDIEDRDFHEDTLAFTGPENAWPAAIAALSDGFDFTPASERRLRLRIDGGVFHQAPEWQYMVHHPVESERGMREHADLFSPGYFDGMLPAGMEIRLTADAGRPGAPPSVARPSPPVPAESDGSLSAALLRAVRHFVVRRDDLKTVIAGYPWFLDWGRDTLICARGLLAAGMTGEVRRILLQFAAYERKGTLPNMISGADTANRDTSDAPLWLIAACADWCRLTGDCGLLDAAVGRRSMRDVLVSIVENYCAGTAHGIRMDAASGLIFSPAHFTWMDTNHPAATPRAGYPVEIQALWWAALDFMADAAGRRKWRRLADMVKAALVDLFWDAGRGYLCDCRHAAGADTPAAEAPADDALRPNQLLALTLGALDAAGQVSAILAACAELLVPGAVRSLADRPVAFALPVQRDGQLLNDPHHPYWPHYAGDEDTRRKPAYHNGTAWTWLFPSFCEAWFKRYGAAGRPAALSWLVGGVQHAINRGCVGHLPEIMDGDAPHPPRGCDAQAWGCTEAYRVLRLLQQRPNTEERPA